jgi:hypothetical protein
MRCCTWWTRATARGALSGPAVLQNSDLTPRMALAVDDAGAAAATLATTSDDACGGGSGSGTVVTVAGVAAWAGEVTAACVGAACSTRGGGVTAAAFSVSELTVCATSLQAHMLVDLVALVPNVTGALAVAVDRFSALQLTSAAFPACDDTDAVACDCKTTLSAVQEAGNEFQRPSADLAGSSELGRCFAVGLAPTWP